MIVKITLKKLLSTYNYSKTILICLRSRRMIIPTVESQEMMEIKVISNSTNLRFDIGNGKVTGFLKMGFEDLNQDFKLPDDYKKIKKLGAGAYGKVMQVSHLPTKKTYAVKRFEEVFSKELRARRLLRELTILKNV